VFVRRAAGRIMLAHAPADAMADRSTKNPPRPRLSDEQLIELYQQGHTEVFEKLIHRYRQELFNFLVRFCGDRTAAEDVFQEAFLQVHLSAGSFDPERRFKPWLFTIAANKARDYLRKRSRRPAAELDAAVSSDGEGQAFIDLLEGESSNPEENMAKAELAEAVQRTISRMPEHLREILLLAYFQQFPYSQIAEVLQIPLGTVKSRLHTAVGTFAKMWKKQNPDEG